MEYHKLITMIGVALHSLMFTQVSFAQAPPQLPEGTTGLAVSYPDDTSIESHPNVLYADDFEGYASVSQLTESGNYSGYYQKQNLSLDTSVLFQGSQSLRMRMPSVDNDMWNAIIRKLPSAQDRLFMRVYARYQSDYRGVNSAHNGLRITGNYSGPGQKPDGTDFFLVNIEESKWESEPEPGYTHAYVYHPEMDNNFGEHWYANGRVTNGAQSFGPYFVARENVAPERGKWICYEVMVKLNTPGIRDGRVAVWHDGKLIADWPDLRFRDVDSVKIDEIQLENGGQSSTQQNDKWYDNLVIATSYIGPISSDSVPKPPGSLRVEP